MGAFLGHQWKTLKCSFTGAWMGPRITPPWARHLAASPSASFHLPFGGLLPHGSPLQAFAIQGVWCCPDHILGCACTVTGAAASGSSVPDTDAKSAGHAGFLPFLLGPACSEGTLSAELLGQHPMGSPYCDRQRAASVNSLRHLATLLGSATRSSLSPRGVLKDLWRLLGRWIGGLSLYSLHSPSSLICTLYFL